MSSHTRCLGNLLSTWDKGVLKALDGENPQQVLTLPTFPNSLHSLSQYKPFPRTGAIPYNGGLATEMRFKLEMDL